MLQILQQVDKQAKIAILSDVAPKNIANRELLAYVLSIGPVCRLINVN
jgi:hypothetical protein